MSVSDEYLTYMIGPLECIGPVQSRCMFGGAGLYFDGLFFALIADDILYFKVDDMFMDNKTIFLTVYPIL